MQSAIRVSQDSEALIRRGYALFNGGNLADLGAIFADDAIWHVSGRNRLSGARQGREAVLAYFGELARLSDGTFRAELHDVLANDEHVVAMHNGTAQYRGKQLRIRTTLVFHVRDGKIAEVWEAQEDQAQVDDFFA